MKTGSACIGALALLMASLPVFAGPDGAMLAGGCTACHGTAGSGAASSIPAIGGQLESYIVESMLKFRQGQRPGSIMGRIAKGYTPEEIKAMAAWFSKQPFVRTPVNVDDAKLARGKKIYENRCRDCHMDSGRKSDHEAALLAGQRLDYLQIQTTDFLGKKRPFPDMMDDAYEGLTKDDLEAVSHYFASQK